MSGEILHTNNEQEYLMRVGDCCIIRPGDMHSLRFPTDSQDCRESHQNLTFFFTNNFAEKVLDLFETFQELQTSKDALTFTMDESSLDQICDKGILTQVFSREEFEISSKLMISQILNIFWEQKTFHNPQYPIWLNNFLMDISHPNNFGKKVEELSKNTSYSYSRLARLFKEYVGETLVDYINDKKMTYAKRLLRTTTLPVIPQITYT